MCTTVDNADDFILFFFGNSDAFNASRLTHHDISARNRTDIKCEM